MDREPVRIILDSAAVLIALVVFFVLLFGLGGVESHDPLPAATLAVAVAAIIVGAAEVAKRHVYSPATHERELSEARVAGNLDNHVSDR